MNPVSPVNPVRPVDPQLATLTRTVPRGAAVALAVVSPDGERLLCHGRTDGSSGEPVTPDTGFELGSVSKTFTALLLAELAARGEVRHRDTVTVADVPLTFLHLATHTSGLPRLPPGLRRSALPAWFTNPYAAYSVAELDRAMGRTRLRNPPGDRVHYSNYGVGLLGRTLAERAGTSYPALLTSRISGPLGLTGTDCEPGAAVGHFRQRPLPPWQIPALPGAGAVRSTARDLLRYLTVHLDPAAAPTAALTAALRDVQRPRLVKPRSTDRICLVWNLRPTADGDVLFHSGGTRGCTSFIAFCPRRGTALAALTNAGPRLDGRFIQTGYRIFRGL
ncbi:serine hydrolase [Kitasatospora sp. CB02891]|uniref:serine hydrolase domain-containing protein n=1 Tax=Kitasatospora sp. CB02891 TaxID=2020329 RepID=UPI001E3FE2C7|nr:serine hydrolase domain-containing protein [Kitasatospora sp. CB02891]